MGTTGQVQLRRIKDMLDHCAPGYVIKAHGVHKLRVFWNGKCFPNLPCGDRRKATSRVEIQVGHVRDLVTLFGIEDCARQYLEILR